MGPIQEMKKNQSLHCSVWSDSCLQPTMMMKNTCQVNAVSGAYTIMTKLNKLGKKVLFVANEEFYNLPVFW
jgi:hypothetical protein